MLESACSQRVVVSFLHVLRFTPQSKTSIPAVTSSRCLQPFLSGAKCPSPPNRMGEPILATKKTIVTSTLAQISASNIWTRECSKNGCFFVVVITINALCNHQYFHKQQGTGQRSTLSFVDDY